MNFDFFFPKCTEMMRVGTRFQLMIFLTVKLKSTTRMRDMAHSLILRSEKVNRRCVLQQAACDDVVYQINNGDPCQEPQGNFSQLLHY